MHFLRRGVVSTSPNPQAGGPPLVGCPRLLIQFIHSYPPYRRPFLHPQPKDAPCRGDRDPHLWLMIIIIITTTTIMTIMMMIIIITIVKIFRMLNSLNRLAFEVASNCLWFHLRTSTCEFHFIYEFNLKVLTVPVGYEQCYVCAIKILYSRLIRFISSAQKLFSYGWNVTSLCSLSHKCIC
jgi:hypothetical protein